MSNEKIKPANLRISQKIGWFVIWPILKFFIRYRYYLSCDRQELKRPLLIVSNHLSYLDPMILGTVLPSGCPAYPTYFIAKDSFLEPPLFGGFLKLFGAFRAWRGQGLERSLAIPKEILRSGCSVVFFPQGRRYQDFALEQGRPGAAVLALTTGTQVLPVAICGMSPFSWKKFFLRQYRVRVIFGKPFSLSQKLDEFFASGNVEVGTQIIMQEIKKLLEQN